MASSVLTSGPTFEWGSMWFYGVATTRIAFQKSPLPTVRSLSTSINILLSWFIHNNPGGPTVISNNQVVCQCLSFQPHPVPESSLNFQDQELYESCYPLCLAKPRTHIYISTEFRPSLYPCWDDPIHTLPQFLSWARSLDPKSISIGEGSLDVFPGCVLSCSKH